MPAIERNREHRRLCLAAQPFSRRVFLALLAAPLPLCRPGAAGAADAHQEVFDLFTEMASALSEGNALAFLKPIDRAMPDYQKLQDNVGALVAQNDLASSIEVLKEQGNEKRREVELDWFLEIRSHEIHGPYERRRQIVKCRLERDKKKWKIVALEPVDFFAPPSTA